MTGDGLQAAGDGSGGSCWSLQQRCATVHVAYIRALLYTRSMFVFPSISYYEIEYILIYYRC